MADSQGGSSAPSGFLRALRWVQRQPSRRHDSFACKLGGITGPDVLIISTRPRSFTSRQGFGQFSPSRELSFYRELSWISSRRFRPKTQSDLHTCDNRDDWRNPPQQEDLKQTNQPGQQTFAKLPSTHSQYIRPLPRLCLPNWISACGLVNVQHQQGINGSRSFDWSWCGSTIIPWQTSLLGTPMTRLWLVLTKP